MTQPFFPSTTKPGEDRCNHWVPCDEFGGSGVHEWESTPSTSAKPSNGLTHEEIVVACRNVGIDLECGACAAQFYTGSAPGLTHTCERKNDGPVVTGTPTRKVDLRKQRRPPMQPIYVDGDNIVRFRANAIVRWLVDSGRVDLNDVTKNMDSMNRYDIAQFWQMLGTSVSAFCGYDFVPRSVVKRADAKMDALLGGGR